jgi:hypothetical protein
MSNGAFSRFIFISSHLFLISVREIFEKVNCCELLSSEADSILEQISTQCTVINFKHKKYDISNTF